MVFPHPDYAYGHSLQEAFIGLLKKLGGTYDAALAPVGTNDFSAYLIKARTSGAKVLIDLMGSGDGASFCERNGTMTELLLFNVTNGLIIGVFYVLMALGLSLILNLFGGINFAHGGFLALGAYVAYTIEPFIGFWTALRLAPLAIALFDVVLWSGWWFAGSMAGIRSMVCC